MHVQTVFTIVSTLVWRAHLAPYHILVMVHVWHAGMLLHGVSSSGAYYPD